MQARSRHSAAGAALALAALALPGAASAHGIDAATSRVQAHTHHADRALGHAASLFAHGHDARGSKALDRSRRQLHAAARGAARLDRRAGTAHSRAAAGRAAALVAARQGADVERLVGMLDDAPPRADRTIARLARADTRGRDKAIAIIGGLMQDGVSNHAAKGLTRALAALSENRDHEVKVEGQALGSDAVSPSAKRALAKAVKADVEGQDRAAAQLSALLADTSMPSAAQRGLQRAYDAVTREQSHAAGLLDRFSDRMPSAVRAFVQKVVHQAQENAQGMREDRPAPPTGAGRADHAGAPPTDGAPQASGSPAGSGQQAAAPPDGAPEGPSASTGERPGPPPGTPAGS